MKLRFYIFLLFCLIYFLPFFVAIVRGHRHLLRTLILNLCFAWTVVGWFVLICSAWKRPPQAAFLNDIKLVDSVQARNLLKRLALLREAAGRDSGRLLNRIGISLQNAALVKRNIVAITESKLGDGELTAERFVGTTESAFQQLVLRCQHLANQISALPESPSSTQLEFIEEEVQQVEGLVQKFADFGVELSKILVEEGRTLQPVDSIVHDLEDLSEKAQRLRQKG